MKPQEQLAFFPAEEEELMRAAAKPTGYRGFYSFHKYWGKKPREPVSYLISALAPPRGVVLDPFVGSGVSVVEAIRQNRRAIGIDINPISIDLCKTILDPPELALLRSSFQDIKTTARPKIYKTYALPAGQQIATHYLWDGDELKEIWFLPQGKRKKSVVKPTAMDLDLFSSFEDYKARYLSKFTTFGNSRINTKPDMEFADIFTHRALRNIEILLDCIKKQPEQVQLPLRLCLTAASGQMSKMVFAITNRRKTRDQSNPIEVGSWVIGYWKPKLHFEINVWNCFERRTRKLIKAIQDRDRRLNARLSETTDDIFENKSDCVLICAPSQKLLNTFPRESIDLVITDPPHSDRMPYLELSSMWNAILGHSPNYTDEIVVSDAKSRGKDKETYKKDMLRVMRYVGQKLKRDGYLVLIYNAREKDSWEFFDILLSQKTRITYLGYLPMAYSAGSVVQDNRAGGLTHDLALVFGKENGSGVPDEISRFPKWSSGLPEKGYTEK